MSAGLLTSQTAWIGIVALALGALTFGVHDASEDQENRMRERSSPTSKVAYPMSDNAKLTLKLHNQTVEGPLALRSWGPFNFG